MQKYIFPILFLFTQVACGQSRLPNIEAAYSKFETDSQLKFGLSSLTVLNAQTGEVIFSRNGNIGLAPASALKTVTSITAFQLLGKDFKWETNLGYSGSIVNGTLNGDVILTGGGDPTLGSNRYNLTKSELLLNRWASSIKKAGINKVNGRIIGDDSLFGSQITPLGWIWQDIGNYYGAGASALSWKENEIGVRFKAGSKVGDKTEFIYPQTDGIPLKIVNEVTTGALRTGDNVYAYSAPYTDIIYLRGTYGIDLNKTIMIAAPDPALSLAVDLKKYLINNGVSVTGFSTTARLLELEKKSFTPASVSLDKYYSPELSKTVYWLNQKSLNLYAENLLKTIAWKSQKLASTENGVIEIKKMWSSRLKIDLNSMAILDGSGLSPENRITTMAMSSILHSAVKEAWYSDFYESLPLNNEMKMKSGSIRNVLAYAGYHKSASGTPVVFTFITNNYNGSTSSIKQKMFRVLDELK